MRPRPSRLPLFRPPPRRLVVAVVLALLTGLLVHRTTSAAADTAAVYGERLPVVVVQRDLAAGSTIESGDVAIVERPAAHLPDDAVTEDPTGSAVRAAVGSGEVLVTSRLAGEGRTGPTALIPAGWRALAIPVIDTPIPTEPGDVVDVIASFDPATRRDPSLVIAADAIVVDVAEDAVTVAVTRERATEVAFALSNGIVTLALVG